MSRVSIIMYHYVRRVKGSRYPGIHGLETEDFIKQLDFLEGNGYTFIRMEDLINAYYEGAALPEKSVLLTFDDAFIDHFITVFPILSERNIQGSFFIPSEVIDRRMVLAMNKIHFFLAAEKDHHALKLRLLEMMDHYRGSEFDFPGNEELLNDYEKDGKYDDRETVFIKKMLQMALPEKLRDILCDQLFSEYMDVSEETLADELYVKREQLLVMKKNGMFIGAHGYHHYHLNALPKEEMKQDIIRGLDCLGSMIDRNSWVMNYPYGSYDETVENEVKALGAKLAITTVVDINDTERYDAFNICRLNTNDFPPKSDKYP